MDFFCLGYAEHAGLWLERHCTLGERRIKPAVWIPLTNASYIAVTCPSCLRTFPVAAPLRIGAHTVECDACTSAVSFHITDEFRTHIAQ
jgi:hypothetical protein